MTNHRASSETRFTPSGNPVKRFIEIWYQGWIMLLADTLTAWNKRFDPGYYFEYDRVSNTVYVSGENAPQDSRKLGREELALAWCPMMLILSGLVGLLAFSETPGILEAGVALFGFFAVVWGNPVRRALRLVNTERSE